jgi:hypothetical protein
VLRLLRMAVDDAQKSTAGQASLNPAQLTAAIRRMALADETAVWPSAQHEGDGARIESIPKRALANSCRSIPPALQEDEDDGAAAGIDLRRLFPLVGKLVPTMAPKVNFMLGPLSYIPEKKAPVRRAAAEKYDASQAARPTEGIDPSKKHEEITTKTVARLHTIVTRLKAPMCLYTFAVDPRDFAQTIENFFHLAFLIKQGTAVISLDARGLPVVGPTGAADNDEALLTHRKQVVMSLTMQQWKDIVRVFEVRQSYIQAELARMDREGEGQADADAADETGDDDDDDDEDEPPRRRRR